MEILGRWCVKIAGVVILSALCDGILPSGNIKKYVRILLGIVLILCVCEPFAEKIQPDFFIAEENNENFKIETVTEKECERVLRLYRANLEKKMTEDLKNSGFECEFEFNIDVETTDGKNFGQIRGIVVTAIGYDGTQDDKIEEILSEKYGVPKNNVAVVGRKK